MRSERLQVLTAEERQVLALRLGEGMAVDQIAAQLGRSPREVRDLTLAALGRLHRDAPEDSA